jgi:ssRNA-specific RNase YbeY (16S rRNA maturation enzyme)
MTHAVLHLAGHENERQENRDIRENVEHPQMAESFGAVRQRRYAEFASSGQSYGERSP